MTPTDDREFERGYPLGPRTCDTCSDSAKTSGSTDTRGVAYL